NGEGYRRYASDTRNWTQIYPLGFLPQFAPDVVDYSVAGGFRGASAGWSLDAGVSFGHNDFKDNLKDTLNASLGPCLAACADSSPGPDRVFGTADDPHLFDQTAFFAGQLI